MPSIRHFGRIASYHAHGYGSNPHAHNWGSSPHTHPSGCGWGNAPSYPPPHNHGGYQGCGCGHQGCGCGHTHPQPPPSDLNSIAARLLGRHINVASSIHSPVRVVIRDGENLIVTADYIANRINVETSNNIIVRIVGFY